MARTVAVVPHTHWDREWYRPFEAFQQKLVEVVDGVLDALEADPRWAGFHLDGQVTVTDDYLDLRPSSESRIRSAVGAGRLSVGPWYVLMDEFCVSAETIVRSLEIGLEKARALGASPRVGYLPDMFGHVSQVPQILRLAGLHDAVVWRGVPAAMSASAFIWRAPDGSEVRAEYLPVGYASGAFLPADPEALVRRVEALESELADFVDPAAPLLLMNGNDHQAIQVSLPDTIAAANAMQDRYEFRLSTLESYIDGASGEGLPLHTGELRSGARAPILMGVLSNRVDLKVAAATAERAVERLAEPLSVLWRPPEDWPGEALARAWMSMLRNSAHDSICGCSADEVTRAVMHRYDRARTIASTIVDDALAIAAVALRAEGPMVVNPSARPRSGLIEITLPGEEPPEGCQQLSVKPAGTEVREGTGADLGRLLGELARDGWMAPGELPTAARVIAGPDAVELFIASGGSNRGSPATAATIAEAWATAGAHRDAPLRVTVERHPSQRVLARAWDIPGYGWSLWKAGPIGVPPVEASRLRLSNSMLSVDVDPESGTFSLNGLAGFGRLVDEGDAGDTYNYCPPGRDMAVDRPAAVDVELLEQGRLRSIIRITAAYAWPERLAGETRCGSMRVDVATDLELRAGEGFLRVTTRFDNRCRDHRLRVLLPLPRAASTTTSECAFATVERGPAEGGPREVALATYPSRRFVAAGGLSVTHEGLLEHELVDEGRALAVTLLRATGVLSRPVLRTRPNTAGPEIPLEGPQMQGLCTGRYALALGEADPWQLSEQVWDPLLVVQSTGTGHLPDSGSRLEVAGAEVSALRRRHGHIELRVFNPSPNPTVVSIEGHRGQMIDLEGRPLGGWADRFELGAWKIANVRLASASLD